MKEVFGLFLLQKIIHCPILHQSLGGRGCGDDDDDGRDVLMMFMKFYFKVVWSKSL